MARKASGAGVQGREEDATPEVEQGAPRAAVIVAHPDDETLWAGGTILQQPETLWFIAALSRASDADRAPRFQRILERYGAKGAMADLEDGPDQRPLGSDIIRSVILQLLPRNRFDMVFTHSPRGEYTRHRRHEEVSRAVIELWAEGKLSAGRLHLFAYDDEGGEQLSRAIESAPYLHLLGKKIQAEKYRLITEIYGFQPESWEARTVPTSEAFWTFKTAEEAVRWMNEIEER